eukprot:6452098-Prymnesium_polylepis.1
MYYLHVCSVYTRGVFRAQRSETWQKRGVVYRGGELKVSVHFTPTARRARGSARRSDRHVASWLVPQPRVGHDV